MYLKNIIQAVSEGGEAQTALRYSNAIVFLVVNRLLLLQRLAKHPSRTLIRISSPNDRMFPKLKS